MIYFSKSEICGGQFSDFQILEPHITNSLFTKIDSFETLQLLSPGENVGQTIYGAGPLFLCMVLAVNLAVTVYSKPG